VIFTPWLNGERTPLDDNHVRAAYANISLTTTRGSLVRATLEGVAFNARWMQHYTEKLVKSRLDSIAFIGGGAESSLWCQIFADVLDREIRRIVEPKQANTRGAALLAAAALGYIGFDEIPDRVRTAETFTPDAANRALYDERFDEFRGFYKANRKLYARINGKAKESGR
jgi:xylulokinase